MIRASRSLIVPCLRLVSNPVRWSAASFSGIGGDGYRSDEMVDQPSREPPIPDYPFPAMDSETTEVKRARLQYQSRKRGMLENDLLLSTFAAAHLPKFTDKQLNLYDRLINGVSNDWDIFYWVVGQKPTPECFNDEVMKLLKQHAKNLTRELRVRQPDLF